MVLTCEQILDVCLVSSDSSEHTNVVHAAITPDCITEYPFSLIDFCDHLQSCRRCRDANKDVQVASMRLIYTPDDQHHTRSSGERIQSSHRAPSRLERLQRSDPNHYPYRKPLLGHIKPRSSTVSSSSSPSTEYSGTTKNGSLGQKERTFSDEETSILSPVVQDKIASPEDYLGVGEQPSVTLIDVPGEVVNVDVEEQTIDFAGTTVTNSGSQQPKRRLEMHDLQNGLIGHLNTLLDTGSVRTMIREHSAREAGFRLDPNFKPSGAYCWGNGDQHVKVIGEHKIYARDSETGKTMKILADVVPDDEFTPGFDFILSFKALSRTGHWCLEADAIVMHLQPSVSVIDDGVSDRMTTTESPSDDGSSRFTTHVCSRPK